MTVTQQASIRQQLRQAVFDCRERGLTESASWAAQQLTGLPKADDAEMHDEAPSTSDSAESDVFMYAKTLFDMKVCPNAKQSCLQSDVLLAQMLEHAQSETCFRASQLSSCWGCCTTDSCSPHWVMHYDATLQRRCMRSAQLNALFS